MKKLLFLATLLLLSAGAFAQSECANAGYTPWVYGHVHTTDGVNHQRICIDSNGDFISVSPFSYTKGASLGVTIPLPSGAAAGTVVVATNGASNTDCTNGGGTTHSFCEYNGTTWVSFGGASSSLPANPTAPNGVPQSLCSTPSGGVGQSPVWCRPGVARNAQIGTTYTVLATDIGGLITLNNAAAQTVTLPDAGSTGFDANYATSVCDIGAGTATIQRQTSSTINYVDGSTYTSAATSFALTTGQCASIYTDPTTSTNWFARIFKTASTTTFSYWPSQTGYNNSTLTAVTNNYVIRGITIPITLSVGHLGFSVTTADGTNNSDICLYNKSGTLIANVGGATYAATGDQTKPISQGTVTISPGAYYLGITSAASTFAVKAAQNIPTFVSFTVVGSSAGTCAASITPPADSYLSTGTIPDVEFLP